MCSPNERIYWRRAFTDLARQDARERQEKSLAVCENEQKATKSVRGPIRDRCCRKLAFPVNDPPFGQIIGREFDANPISRHDADKVLTHPTGDMGQNDVSTFDLDAKSSISQ